MAENTPLFSIVIPIYNSEKTITEAVASIINQNFEQKYEIILVNDGSTDNSKKICSELTASYPDLLKVIHQKNSGSFLARLTGATKASGQYVIYLDSDDILLDGALQQFFNDIEEDVDLILYDHIMESIGKTSTKRIKTINYDSKKYFSLETKKELFISFMNGYINSVCGMIIKRSLLDKSTARSIVEKINITEDRLQKMFLLLEAKKIIYSPVATFLYRWQPRSLGGDLRTGRLSISIYHDQVTCWKLEREHYNEFDFTQHEQLYYDAKKLSRICSLVENEYTFLDKISLKNALVQYISDDAIFIALYNKKVLTKLRRHNRIISKFIFNKSYLSLKTYLYLSNIARRVKYVKK